MKLTNFVKFFLPLCLFPLSAFATTNVIFSNNSLNDFVISSEEIDSTTNLVLGRDYNIVKNLNVGALVSNVNSLNFNSNVNIKNGKQYHFRVSVLNKDYPSQSLAFYITTEGLFTGSKIIETSVVLPSGNKVFFDPKKSSNLDISEFWNNEILRFVPYTTVQDTISWPSFVIAIDKKNKLEVPFDNSSFNTFRAMSYNVQLWPIYGDIVNPPNNKLIRAKDLPGLIGNGFDYVALDEVFDKDIRTKMIADMKKNYPYYVDAAGMDTVNFLTSGVVVFSKWPIIQSKQHVFDSCYDIDCLASKGITYVKIKKNVNGLEQIYNIFSTHMQATSPLNFDDPLNQTREKQIIEFVKFIKDQNIPASEPVLIAGDLNVNAFGTTEEYFNGIYPQTEYQFLLSAFNAVDPVQTGLKYSSDYILNTMLALNSHSQSKIDYVLYLKDHKTPIYSTNQVITMRDMANPSMYPVYDLSDHFPIIGEFIF